MKSDHLHSHSRRYALLRKIISFYHEVYYEDICVINADNIPENEPVIFAPNHQNALMDALAIIFTTKKQILFMARADIFKKESIKKILTFMKIIPVYRIRDGKEALANNDESFEIAFRSLKNNEVVGIMPEGNHGDQHRLRPLKKGFARLAMQSQELLDSSIHVKIVPVGLEYSNYQAFRGNLLIKYGTPIDVREYMDVYSENPAKALQSLRERVAKELVSLMINIDTDDYYETIYQAKELFSSHNKKKIASLNEKFEMEKKLTGNLLALVEGNTSELNDLRNKLKDLELDAGQLNLKPWVLGWENPKKSMHWFSEITRYFAFLPVFAVTALFHAVPYYASEYFSNRAKDKQFVSSMRFLISYIFYILWYLLMLLFPISIILKGILLITMPVLGILSFDFGDSLKKIFVKIRFVILKRQNSNALIELQKDYANLINWLTVKSNL